MLVWSHDDSALEKLNWRRPLRPPKPPKAPSLLRRRVSLFEPNRGLGPLASSPLHCHKLPTQHGGVSMSARAPKKTRKASACRCNYTAIPPCAALHRTSQLQLGPRRPGSPHDTHTHTLSFPMLVSPVSHTQSIPSLLIPEATLFRFVSYSFLLFFLPL